MHFLLFFLYGHVGTQCKLRYENYVIQNGLLFFGGEGGGHLKIHKEGRLLIQQEQTQMESLFNKRSLGGHLRVHKLYPQFCWRYITNSDKLRYSWSKLAQLYWRILIIAWVLISLLPPSRSRHHAATRKWAGDITESFFCDRFVVWCDEIQELNLKITGLPIHIEGKWQKETYWRVFV